MQETVQHILDELRRRGELSPKELDRIIRGRSARAHDGRRVFAKKHILPFYLQARTENGDMWRSWNVDARLDELFVKTLQMKPRRTASGVATVTVLTKPWPCSNRCIYCPDDPRMPKSYLSDEPACQRAERNGFDPYRQIASRLGTLAQMGHPTGKVEVIILGGTWTDYPEAYRLWFVSELFRALNDGPDEWADRKSRQEAAQIDGTSTLDALRALQAANETSAHRMVGLVVETRPDSVSCDALRHMRELGCTKVQLGVQSIDDAILAANGRRETAQTIACALQLARLFGFKTHAHFMPNLLGATPESDKRDFNTFANDPRFSPDEAKLYPCALVAGTELVRSHERGEWRPYTEEELLDVLVHDMAAAPPFMRVSRMIRDISAKDILVGNKKTNLRQLVDERLGRAGIASQEIRFREIGTEEVDLSTLALKEHRYTTLATDEVFLEWVTPEGKIAGFLRLSLPHADAVQDLGSTLPVKPGDAMVREVHVYGFSTLPGTQGDSAQHHGLGRKLVERACEIARDEGFVRLNVISAVGTRGYYRRLGFEDNGLYQVRSLR